MKDTETTNTEEQQEGKDVNQVVEEKKQIIEQKSFTTEGLIQQLKSAGEFPSKELIAEILNAGNSIADNLIELIQKSEEEVAVHTQIHATRILGQMKLEKAIPTLISNLKDKSDIDLIDETSFALAQIGKPALTSIIEYIRNPENKSKMGYAVPILGIMQYPETFDLLAELLQSDEVKKNIPLTKIILGVISKKSDTEKIKEVLDKLSEDTTLNIEIKNEIESIKEELKDTNRKPPEDYENRDILKLYHPKDKVVDAIYEKHQKAGARVIYQGGTYEREYPKVGRNDPCPCGSGKKYKKCHGKTAS